MILEDGTGKGYQAKINDENQLEVSAVSLSIEHHVNHSKGNAYNLLFSATPTGANDCFLYIRNENRDIDLVIEGFSLKLAADDYVEFALKQIGTPVGGTQITPVNLNTSSGSSAIGTFLSGNDITGLSGGSTAMRFYHANSNESIYRNFEQDIIIGYNGSVSLYIGTGGVALDGMICFNYHNSNG